MIEGLMQIIKIRFSVDICYNNSNHFKDYCMQIIYLANEAYRLNLSHHDLV